MPQKDDTKTAKRAKLSGIAKFFKNPRQVEHTSTSTSHVSSHSSDSGNINLPFTSSKSIGNQLQGNTIAVNNSSLLAELFEHEKAESQHITSAALSRPLQHNEKHASPFL